MRKKQVMTFVLAAMMAGSMTMTAFADWKWQDIDNNGVSECYYYNDEFYNNCDDEFKRAMHFWDLNNVNKTIRTTPDGYQINAARQWIVDGVVQTQNVETETASINTQTPYDPEHPLARVVDAWDLRLPKNYIGGFVICNDNVQALLTNQMNAYYIPPAGYSINPTTGSQMYISQEGYDENVKNTQALYNWFCNWLNGMNFESMSEMDKAKEIQKVLAQGINQTGMGELKRNADYSVLIDKQGVCAEYAMTATSLAKALGLKSAVSGTGDHAVYYIQVDGVGYFGQNNELNLDNPTPDYVYFQ